MSKKSAISQKKVKLILASGSPRRAALLKGLGITFSVQKPEVDESTLPNESSKSMVERLSRIKCRSVNGPIPVLAADTIVVFKGQILGKPQNREDAKRMLQLLAGNTHEVMTGFCLKFGEREISQVVFSEVTFKSVGEMDILRYVESAEPMDKAGAYAIQGGASRWVTKLDGSLTNVMGLPLKEVWAAFAKLGILG